MMPSLSPWKRTFRSIIFRLYYAVYVKRKINREDRVRLGGLVLTVPPTVFHPSLYLTSSYFAKYISSIDLAGKTVLDLGCGSGILALTAASRGARVTAVDLNPAAVRATNENARANGLDGNVNGIESDLFSNLPGAKFELIITNPPYLTGVPADMAGNAWRAGKDWQFFKRLAEQLRDHLEPAGRVLMILSTDADIDKIESIFKDCCFVMNVIASQRQFFEGFFIYEIVPSQPTRQ